MKQKTSAKRTKILLSCFIGVIVVYFAILSYTVIADSNKNASDTVRTYDIPVEAARGEILDRNGVTLVSNRQGNSIRINAAIFPSNQQDRNRIIASLIELCESSGEEWTDNLPLEFNVNGVLVFKENRENDIKALKHKNMLNLNAYATAQNCLDALIEMYSLEEYDDVTARKIASVQYEMWRTGYSLKNPYTFADDVSNITVSIIKEKSEYFTGVETEIKTYREFTDGTLAPHIIGVTGIISGEEYNSYTDKLNNALLTGHYSEEDTEIMKMNAYTLTDFVGKFGIEGAMEEFLRGKKGIKQISIDGNNNVTSHYTLLPEQGSTIMLTIDSGLQRVAQNALETRILELTSESELPPAGAVAVLDVDTGEILASASYPSYDITGYFENYNDLLKADGSPLINRVLQSTYEPGSTMKLSTAIAGLEESAIDTETKFNCNSIFQYYDVTFSCLDSHGNFNVISAIEESCNIFFYNVAQLLGIDIMNEYSKKLGLGEKTGVELSESKGILAGRAYRTSIGSIWQMGDTIQAAIGQSDNLFTIIQLANYAATIANNGTRYNCHYVKNIMTADHTSIVQESKPVIAENTGISRDTIDIVKQGMLAVTTTGSCTRAFEKITEGVGAKTGTTQVKKIIDGRIYEGNNGLNISFAPFNEPEIAIAVIIENVDSGTATATVAADIYEYYFATKNQISSQQPSNELLR